MEITYGACNGSGTIKLPFLKLIVRHGLVKSMAEAKRLAKAGAIKEWTVVPEADGRARWRWWRMPNCMFLNGPDYFSADEEFRIGKHGFVKFIPKFRYPLIPIHLKEVASG